MKDLSPLANALSVFPNVIYTTVQIGNRINHELRLYTPLRITIPQVPTWLKRAMDVYSMLNDVSVIQLESNRAGLCVNAFVNPETNPELLAAVNEMRKDRGYRPCVIHLPTT